MPRTRNEPVRKSVTGRHAEPIEVGVRPKGCAPASKARASKPPGSKAPASTEPARKAPRSFQAAAAAVVAATQGAVAAVEVLLQVRRPDAPAPEGEAAQRAPAVAETAPEGAQAGGADGENRSAAGAPAEKRRTGGDGSLSARLHEALSRRSGATAPVTQPHPRGSGAEFQTLPVPGSIDEIARTLAACWTKAYGVFHAMQMRFEEDLTRTHVARHVKVASWRRDATYPYIIIEVVDVPALFVLPSTSSMSAASPHIASLYDIEGLPKEVAPTFHAAAVVAPGRLVFPPRPADCTRGRVTLGRPSQATREPVAAVMDVSGRSSSTVAESTVLKPALERYSKRLAEMWSDVFGRMYRERSAFDDEQARLIVEQALGAPYRWHRREQHYITVEWAELPYCFVLPAVRSPSETTPHLASFYWTDRILAPSSAPRFETVAAVPRGSLHFPPTFGTLTMGRMSLAR
jgi:hypothetical protein